MYRVLVVNVKCTIVRFVALRYICALLGFWYSQREKECLCAYVIVPNVKSVLCLTYCHAYYLVLLF